MAEILAKYRRERHGQEVDTSEKGSLIALQTSREIILAGDNGHKKRGPSERSGFRNFKRLEK